MYKVNNCNSSNENDIIVNNDLNSDLIFCWFWGQWLRWKYNGEG